MINLIRSHLSLLDDTQGHKAPYIFRYGLCILLFCVNLAFSAEQPHTVQHTDGHSGVIGYVKSFIPPDMDILYISSFYSALNEPNRDEPKQVIPPQNDKAQSLSFSLNAMKEDGSDKTPIVRIDGAPIFSLSASPRDNVFAVTLRDMDRDADDNRWLNRHIWLYENGRLKQFTHGMVHDSDVAWSHDAQYLYFTRSVIRVTGDNEIVASEGNIWRATRLDGTLKQITYSSSERVANIMPVPAPDGKRMLFTSNQNGPWQIHVMNIEDESRSLFIAGGVRGNWSPDGKLIAYVDAIPGDIYLADQSGKMLRKITNQHSVQFAPSWSPDGRQLIYSMLNAEPNTNRLGDEQSTQSSAYPKPPMANIWKTPLYAAARPIALTDGGLENRFPIWISARP